MDGMTEKYSVFDFFNLLISGILLLIVLGTECYVWTQDLVKKVMTLSKQSEFIFTIATMIFACVALVSGSAMQVLGIYVIDWKIGWEKRIIRSCLYDNVLWDNSIRLNCLRIKACHYLQTTSKENNWSPEQCSAFFAHCVYYLHVKGLDKKVEKLRETQGLSQLLTCVFGIGFCCSYIIPLIQYFIYGQIKIPYVIITNFICALLALMFYGRYKISGKNRICMVLSIYDASIEMEEHGIL